MGVLLQARLFPNTEHHDQRGAEEGSHSENSMRTTVLECPPTSTDE